MAISTIDNNGVNLGQLGNRNLIINGSMAISQRNGTSVISPAPSGYGSADRFATYKSGAGTFSIQQSTDSPSGFINSIKATVTSASTPSGTNYYLIQHAIEGQNFASLAQGTSDAKTFTLSFYVKSSITGTFSGSFRDSTPSISYVFEYTINSVNTWERKTITVDGSSSGTFSTGNSTGAYLAFSLGQGTTYGSSTVGSWHSGNYHGSSSETKFIANANATFQITGVQLEVGDTATPFEHRSYGDELAKCQRYYEELNLFGVITSKIPNINRHQAIIYFKGRKRATPTINTPFCANFQPGGGSGTTAILRTSVDFTAVQSNSSSGGSWSDQFYNAGAVLQIDAEL